jgi:hypothetical protein
MKKNSQHYVHVEQLSYVLLTTWDVDVLLQAINQLIYDFD